MTGMTHCVDGRGVDLRKPRRVASFRGGPCGSGDRGVALILALLVLSILIVLVVQFTWSARVDERLVDNFLADDAAYYGVVGGLTWAKAVLRHDQVEQAQVDSLREDWVRLEDVENNADVGDLEVTVLLTDHERRIDINGLHDENLRAKVQEFLERLCVKLELTQDDVAGRIVDYVDPDEDGSFEVGAINQRIRDLAELEQVTDLEYEALYGRFDEITGERIPGVLDFLTTLSSGKININTASPEVLHAILPEKDKDGKEINAEVVVERIVEFRGDPDPEKEDGEGADELPPGEEFQTVSELAEKIEGLKALFKPTEDDGDGGGGSGSGSGGGGEDSSEAVALESFLDVRSHHFRVEIEARGVGILKQAVAVIRRHDQTMDVVSWREKQR